MSENLRRLRDTGVAVWRDDISPPWLRGGALEAAQGMVGLAVGAAVLHRAISEDAAYRAELRQLGTGRADPHDAVLELTAAAAREAADALRPVFDTTGGVDGLVTVELDPRLAQDSEATVAEAKRAWSLIGRPNLQVAIPATTAGLPAITTTLAAGIGVNAVLIFSANRLRSVLAAFLDGFERAAEDSVSATASFSVSDLDTEIDKRLWKVGTDGSAALRGTAALANARLAYAAYENALRGGRWKALPADRARPRLAWTSTRVKDPYYLETRYVDELVAPGVVSIMSAATLAAVSEYSELRGDTIHGTYEDAYNAVAALTSMGVDHTDVERVLEAKALDKLAASWHGLRGAVESALRQPVG